MHYIPIPTVLFLFPLAAHGYVWPDTRLDLVEGIRFQHKGYNAGGLADGVTPCNTYLRSNSEPGTQGLRSNAADWIRTVGSIKCL
jgi:hypothetical protein